MRRIEVTCILCPVGCRLTVTEEDGEWKVEGYGCRRGLAYGLEEAQNPSRVLITVIPVDDGELPVVPVKTSKPIPKNLLLKASKALAGLRVKAPVRLGQVIARNILDLDVNIVATRSIKARRDRMEAGGQKIE